MRKTSLYCAGALVCAVSACGSTAWAQQAAQAAAPAQAAKEPDGLHVSGSLRLRYETIDGQPRAGFNDSDALTSLQTRLKVGWKRGPVELVAELHDSRAWGADAGTTLDTTIVNTFEPVQAYVRADLGDVLGSGTRTTVQAGRFVMVLGSSRLVANDEYRNTASGFTGIRADFAGRGGFKATAIYVLPQLRLPDDGPSLRANESRLDKESFSAVLWGGLISRQRKGSPLLVEATFLHFGERDSPGRATRDRSLNTVAVRFDNAPRAGRFDWAVEAMYQWGHVSASLAADAPRLGVSASFLRLQAGYSFGGAWKPRLLFEFDRASGDGPGPGFGRFDTLFGMRRADFAPSGIYAAVARANIASPALRVDVAPGSRFEAFLRYRLLYLAESRDAFANSGVRDASGNSGSFAGHQFDLRLRYWLMPKRLRAEVNGLYLAKGRFLKAAPNAPRNGDTRYASFNLTASF